MLVLLCTAALLLLFGNTESAVEIHKDNAEIRNYEASPEGTYIGLCLIAKNENKFLREWVDYHKYIGVGKFYIYDHNSTIPMNAIVEDYISSGLVLYKYLTDEWREDTYKLNEQNYWFNGVKQVNSPQRWVHTDCFQRNARKHRFMAMIDVDEFIVLNRGKDENFLPVQDPDLPAFLQDFEDYGGLYVFWRIYGSSGHIKSPPGGVLENYINCEYKPGNAYDKTDVKHIVNTQYIDDAFCVIHTCVTSKSSVDSLFREKKMTENKKSPTWEFITLNHYMLKSMEDYSIKRQRGGGHTQIQSLYASWRGERFFNSTNGIAKDDCSYMKQIYQQCCQNSKQLF
eukprot:TRINITY_DN7576_c0_g3_i3.p2 TRINITY_DN7576_c0_g3~~TRINITY_DN7576_c0_g3_i3.p2  ORF type:complete len:341 (+),score=20.43 TRINITY_DN7576_c0_g3_i3:223-1245(+)